MGVQHAEHSAALQTAPQWTSFFIALLRKWIRTGRLTAVIIYSLGAGVAVCGIVLRVWDLRRSLWLDEAWVANSVIASSLRGMFYYDFWLQTSPPLFLLLERATVASLGLSNLALRLIPLLMGIAAIASMIALSWHLLSRQHALLTLFVLSGPAIEYSQTLKQYSSELAITTTILLATILYLERPTRRRFGLLTGIIVIGSFAAYPVAFIWPGMVLVLFLRGKRSQPLRSTWFRSTDFKRGVLLSLIAGACLIVEYWLFAVPNVSPVLRSEFSQGVRDAGFASVIASNVYALLSDLPIPGRLIERAWLGSGLTGTLLLVGFGLAYLRFRRGERRWLEIQTICLLPCLLCSVAKWFNLYVMSTRTRLFLVPCVVVVLISSLQLISEFVLGRWNFPTQRLLGRAALGGITIVALASGVHRAPSVALTARYEDMDGAVSFLRSQVQSEDLLWVHSTCSEAFKLYTRMFQWTDVPAKLGHTGWPCCPRGVPNMNGTSTESAVRNDFGGGVPTAFSGRIFLLYTGRTDHWTFVGLDEPKVMKTILQERGCSELPAPRFQNVVVNIFACGRAN